MRLAARRRELLWYLYAARTPLPGFEAEIFWRERSRRRCGDLGVVVGRRDFDDIHCHELYIEQAAKDRCNLVIAEAPRYGRTGSGRCRRIEAVDIEGQIGLRCGRDSRHF